MEKKFLYIAFIILDSFTCFGQHSLRKGCDTIYLRSGKKIAGKVIQIEEFVHYQEQNDTNIYHRIGTWKVTYIKTASGKRLDLPLPERYSTTLRHHPFPSSLDQDTIILKHGKELVGKIIKVDDYVHYTMANDKKNGYKVATWKVDYIKYSSGKIFRPKD